MKHFKNKLIAIDRLAIFLKYINIRPRAFEKSVQVANGYLSRQIKNKGSIGSTILEKIHKNYKQLNIIWVLTGEGSMLNDQFIDTSKQIAISNLKKKSR